MRENDRTAELHPVDRLALLRDVADVMVEVGGRYMTGPDVRTTTADMGVLHELTDGLAFSRPAELGGSGNSSHGTARGVLGALDAALPIVCRRRLLEDLTIGVVGLGSMGRLIASALVERGASVLVHDRNEALRPTAEAEGLTWVAGQTACDDVDVLDRRGITFIPDSVASAGGVVRAVWREEFGLDEAATEISVDVLGTTVVEILTDASQRGVTTVTAAHDLAVRRRRVGPAH